MPAYFLAKTEPSTYSIQDLALEGETNWDGVRNYQAINVIKSWQPGDLVIIYHSVKEARIVGLAMVVGSPQPDEQDTRGISWHARLAFVREFADAHKISLRQIKETGLFADFALVRQSRLSTMSCPQKFVDWLQSQGVDLTAKAVSKI